MIPRLIAWHYSQGLKTLIEALKNFSEFIWEQFSVVRFLKSLLSPWRRDVSRVARRGLHPLLFAQALVENIFTRILGAIVKIFIIVAAILLELFILFFGLLVVLIWVTVPLAMLISLGELIFLNYQTSSTLALFWGLVFLLSLVVLAIALKYYRIEKKDYYSMSLADLGQERWFVKVWNRIGKRQDEIEPNLLGDSAALKQFLTSLDITMDEFAKIVDWEMRCQIETEKKKIFWSRENLLSSLPIGKNWAYAYTVNLDKYARDLSEGDYSEYRNAELIGKEKELEELTLILTKPSQNNVILIGEPGVGRDTIIHTLAKKIRENKSIPILANKRILEIDFKEVLSNYGAGTSDGILHSLFSEATYAGNIIIVMKNIHEYLRSDTTDAARDISPIISEYLTYPSFQIIGTTTPGEFHAHVEKKEGVMKYCDKIWVEQASQEDTLLVLLYKLKTIEKNGVFMTFQAIREIVNLSDRYINDTPFPEKALDVMEEVILHWNNSGSMSFVDKALVDDAISNKLKVPLGEVTGGESEKLLNLEEILHKRVVGQNLAVTQIAETVRRTRIGMVQKDKPLGSFLFMGPTGVGKTESSKALAEAYFGDEDRMIRLDMSEYQAADSIDRILGSAATGKEGYLISKVKESPYSLLLIDEIEKAYPEILNLFLQILDEGYLTDAFGKKISFRNLIIIATSNAGSDVIKESIQSGLTPEETQNRLLDHVISKGIFRPEFLNRFGGVVFFHPLTPDDILKVTQLLLQKYAVQTKQQENIDLTYEEGVAQAVADKAYDPIFGARAINRYIQDAIEDNLAKKIIGKEVPKGGVFEFKVSDLE